MNRLSLRNRRGEDWLCRVQGIGVVAVEGAIVSPHRPGDPSQLVGQSDGRLVMTDALFQAERPAVQATKPWGAARASDLARANTDRAPWIRSMRR